MVKEARDTATGPASEVFNRGPASIQQDAIQECGPMQHTLLNPAGNLQEGKGTCAVSGDQGLGPGRGVRQLHARELDLGLHHSRSGKVVPVSGCARRSRLQLLKKHPSLSQRCHLRPVSQ